MKQLQQLKSTLLLTAYLFIAIVGSFHFHPYSYNLNHYFSLSESFPMNSGNEISDNVSGNCSVEHFFQSLNVDTALSIAFSVILPEASPLVISSSFRNIYNVFNTSFSLRAPPVI